MQINQKELAETFMMIFKVIYHPLYGMNNYVLIWGDWLSCDPLRGSHDSQSPHIRKHLCPILWQLWIICHKIIHTIFDLHGLCQSISALLGLKRRSSFCMCSQQSGLIIHLGNLPGEVQKALVGQGVDKHWKGRMCCLFLIWPIRLSACLPTEKRFSTADVAGPRVLG